MIGVVKNSLEKGNCPPHRNFNWCSQQGNLSEVHNTNKSPHGEKMPLLTSVTSHTVRQMPFLSHSHLVLSPNLKISIEVPCELIGRRCSKWLEKKKKRTEKTMRSILPSESCFWDFKKQSFFSKNLHVEGRNPITWIITVLSQDLQWQEAVARYLELEIRYRCRNMVCVYHNC